MTQDLIILNEEFIKDKIYYIRGKKVMIDFELAEIYGYTTKRFNEQVKNNIERFDDEFRFQLTHEELEILLRSKFSTLNKNQGRGKHFKYLPYVFTEEGIYMLMTVLKGEKAVKQSKVLIKVFKSMKDFIVSNDLYKQLYLIENKLLDHDYDIKLLQETFEKLEEKKMKNEIYFNGQVYDSYSKIIDILNEAKEEIIIIDSYADKKVLDIIKGINKIVIIITKKNNLLKDIDIEKYNRQYNNLKVIYNNTFHDRFIIIDSKTFYHLGTSLNNLGIKTFAINFILEDSFKEDLLTRINSIIM